ncbi:recombinase family protein [Methylobacter luteus]|jgi:hypothetical protein
MTGDTLLVWKLDRLGRDLRHLVNTVHDLTGRSVGLKVLNGHGAAIDTTTAAGKLVFGIFAALSEFERELITERTVAGLASARARGRKGGRPFKMPVAKHGGHGPAGDDRRGSLQGIGYYPADVVPTCFTERRTASRWCETVISWLKPSMVTSFTGSLLLLFNNY